MARRSRSKSQRGYNSRRLQLERLEPRQLLAANLVITEIMANNNDNVGLGEIERNFNKPDPFGDGSTPDWVEIFNSGDEAIDLAGHHLTDDRDDLDQWTFPTAVLEPGGYMLVYASGMVGVEPTDFVDALGNIHTNFGLDDQGDYVALVAPDGTTVLSEFDPGGKRFPDQLSDVSYGYVQTSRLVSTVSDASYWVPLHGDFGTDWTLPDFDPAANGFSTGKASLGYESRPNDRTNFSGEFETELPAGIHAVYVRMEFDLEDKSGISSLLLRLKRDNGVVVYLNGVEAARDNAPDNLDWFNTAVGSSPRDSQAREFEDFDLSDHSDALRDGKNVLAFHLLNYLSDDSDMLLVPELFADKPIAESNVGFLVTPTPGASNIVFDAYTGPLFKNMTQNPGELAEGEDLVVTTIVKEHNAPVDSVTLHYRVMFEEEVKLTMVDDGSGADEMAGDGIYTATIPASAGPGQMLRWRATAVDVEGNPMRWPLAQDPIDSDEYFGTIVTDPSLDSSNLPILHWFIENPRGADGQAGARGSFFYLGEFYDNVDANIHGQSSSGFPKKSYDVDFNEENRFKWQEDEIRVRDINLLTNWADKGKFRNTLSYEMYRVADAPYLFAFTIRVQQNGEFFNTMDMVEDADDRTLERLGLNPNGALYKMYNTFTHPAVGEKKTRKWEDQSDLQELRDATNLRGDDWINYAYDNLDIPEMVNFLTVFDTSSNHDCCHKNYYFYRDTGETNEWQIHPWDVDLSFGHVWTSDVNYFNDTMNTSVGPKVGSNNTLMGKLYNSRTTPGVEEMYFRRLRTLLDQYVQPSDTPYEDRYIERRLDELIAQIDPHDDPFDPTPQPPEWPSARNGTVLGTDDADLDYNKWGSWEHGNGSRLHAARGETMREHIQRVKEDFLPARRDYLYRQRLLPEPQIGNPILNFGVIEVEPTSGNPAEQYIQLTNPHDTAVDISGWKLAEAVDFTFPGGTVIPSGWTLHVAADKNAFRARTEGPTGGQGLFIVGGWDGELSTEGEPLTLIGADGNAVRRVFVGTIDDPTPVQEYLRLTEVNYAPHAPNPVPGLGEVDDGTPDAADKFEFIELANTGREPLDLTGVKLSAGIDFTFPEGTTVGGGKQILVVKDQTAFESRYGTGMNIAGEYSGTLDDNGDSVFLDDAGNLPIPGQAFTYGTAGDWPGQALGKGSSLQVADTSASYDDPANWRASAEFGGSPGTRSVAATPPVLFSEVMPDGPQPEGDRIELFNAAYQDVDISGWYVSNSNEDYFKYRIPATTPLPGRSYFVLDQSQFGFDLDSWRGDSLWLIQADSEGKPIGFVDHVSFEATASGVSVGPLSDGDPDRPVIAGRSIMVPLEQSTFGGPNAERDPGSVVITEFQYNNPDDIDGRGRLRAHHFEYVELYNRSNATLDLTDWQLTGSVEMTFAAGTTLDAGQTLLVMGFDPSEGTGETIYRFSKGVPTETQMVGPYEGDLHDEDSVPDQLVLRLQQPGTPPPQEPNFTPYITLDEVHYGVDAPWPPEANGGGNSLTRLSPDAYGDFPTSWAAAPITPGTVDVSSRIVGDSNDDGQFDQVDITLVLQSGKYATGEPATWSEGDWTGDGQFDRLDIMAALQAGTYLQAPLQALAPIESMIAKRAAPTAEGATLDAADLLFAEVGADEEQLP